MFLFYSMIFTQCDIPFFITGTSKVFSKSYVICGINCSNNVKNVIASINTRESIYADILIKEISSDGIGSNFVKTYQ